MSKQSNNLKDFVSAAFDTYKSVLSKFSTVAAGASNDESKAQQAIIYLTDVGRSIANDYIKSNTEATDDGSLLFNIVSALLDDSRVQGALGLAGGIWDALTDRDELEDSTAFNAFAATIQSRDDLREQMSSFCC